MNRKIFTLFCGLLLYCSNIMSSSVEYVKYDMTFKGRGEAETVQSVTVENLTSGNTLYMTGTDTLRLTSLLSSFEDVFIHNIQPKLFPNPATSASLLDFVTIRSGKVMISVTDLSGTIQNIASFDLVAGEHSVVIPVSNTGLYLISIQGGGVSKSMKWMCIGSGTTNSSIQLQTDASIPKDGTMSKTKVQKIASDANVVEMYFEKGDLLRFTGQSGNMTTIVMNEPSCSHDITYDFYDCTDATGRHYPIVNVGGMLWMTEDLGMVSSKVAIRSSASAWTDYPDTQAKAAYYEYSADNASKGAYYNLAGATAALPTGWKLPTAGEIDKMLTRLGGYDLGVQLLKSRSDNAWGVVADGADTISFGAIASGMLSAEGAFTGIDYKVNYWTRSTKSQLPIYWGIENDEMKFSASQTTVVGNGFRVRGVRAAPSDYEDVISSIFTSTSSNVPQRASQLFTSGPLGDSYIVSTQKQQVFVDYSYMYNVDYKSLTSDNKAFYRYKYESAFSSTLMGTGTGISPYLKKSTAQNNSTGRQNLVVATWNRPLELWNQTTGIAGDGTISLIIYGDSTQNYERIDSITLPDNFTMGNYFTDFSSTIMYYTGQPNYVQVYLGSYKNQLFEEYSSRFFIRSADFNDDGIGDFVVGLDKKVIVYDGVSHTKLYEKTFAPYGGNNVRIAVGDVDGDQRPDIAAVYQYGSASMMRVEVYPGANLAQTPTIFNSFTFATTTTSTKTFEDIQIADVTGDGINNIVAMATGNYDAPQVCVLEYDTASVGYLKQNVSYKCVTSNAKSLFNYNVSLVHSRGSVYPADIVVGRNYLRFTDKQDGTGTGTLSAVVNNFINNTFVHSDNIVPGNFNNDEEGKEQLMGLFMLGYSVTDYSSEFKSYNTIYPYFVQLNGTTLTETLLSSPSIRCMYAAFNYDYTSRGQMIVTSLKIETMQVPVIGATRSIDPAKVLKYVGHQSTLSDPRIYALLAAPPYYKHKTDGVTPYEYEYDMGTSWGMSSTKGTSTENESTHTATAIFGYEQEFTVPIIGTKIGSIDFTTELSFAWTHGKETTSSITKSNTFTTKNNDAVILLANFYDTYTYEIIQSGNTDDLGSNLTISLPSESRMMMMTVDDYERLTADNRNVPKLRNAFVHTVGYPFTYPKSASSISKLYGSTMLSGGSVDGNQYIGAGSGGNLNRSISLDESTSSSSSFTFDLNVELVGTAFGIKAGAGYGYNNSNTTTHTEGSGHTVAGIVAGLRTLGEAGLSDFKWNVCWYKKSLGGQTFPVVYYVVPE